MEKNSGAGPWKVGSPSVPPVPGHPTGLWVLCCLTIQKSKKSHKSRFMRNFLKPNTYKYKQNMFRSQICPMGSPFINHK